MRRTFIAILLTLSAGAPAEAADETAAGHAIRSLFPDYVVMLATDLDPEMLAYLRQRDPAYHDRSLTVVTADFDGNGREDHAALIRTRDKSQAGFVMILQTGDGRFRAVHEVFFRGVPDYVFLSRVEARREVRQTEAIDAPMKSALLQHPAVELVYFEKASVVFYWNPETRKIEDIATAD